MYKSILFLLLALSLEAKMIDGTAIIVENEPITLMDISTAMEQTHLDQKQTIDMLIRKKLEEHEISKRHIEVSEDDVIAEIKNLAKQNNMTVSQFYEAVSTSQNLTSSQVQEEMKKRLMNQKLFQAIAFTHMDEPDDQEIKDYYTLNKSKFTHPQSFTTTIFEAKTKEILQEKVDNPMFYSPEITSNQQTFEYDKIAPQLAQLLQATPLNHFSQIVPNGRDGFVSFYIENVSTPESAKLEDLKPQISNMIMADKREQILKDYFDRARLNADIQTIRLTND